MECCTHARHRIAGAMADQVVVFVLSRMLFLNRFVRLSRESNELFLGAASAISRPEIFEVSIAGKRFLYQNKSENHAMLKMFVEHTRLTYTIFRSYQGSVLWDFFTCDFSLTVHGQNQTWSWGFFRDLSYKHPRYFAGVDVIPTLVLF